jgi:protein-tyrosine phosphatase
MVQLTGWEENGMIKADRYLSSGSFGKVAVKMGKETWRDDIKANVTQFRLNELDVVHYMFEAWPDHGVPQGNDVEALRRLVLEVETVREGEVWVHW